MKRVFLLGLLIIAASSIFGQDGIIDFNAVKKITKVDARGTYIYLFENGKLITKTSGNKEIVYKYNERGLLSEEYYVISNGTKVSKHYHYDSDGYIFKVELKEKDKLTGEVHIKSEIKNDENFSITKDHKSLTGIAGPRITNTRNYEMSKNVLTLKVESYLRKSTRTSLSESYFENGNIVRSNIGSKAKSKYSMSFKYDDKLSLDAAFKQSMLGDKHFINGLLMSAPILFRSQPGSKNNLVEETIEKESKTISVGVYRTKIEYNSDKLPVEVISTRKNGNDTERISIEY